VNINHRSDLSIYEKNLETIQARVGSLSESFSTMAATIRGPEADIKTKIRQLERIHDCCELMRVLVRFLHLAKRLGLQMENTASREFIKAAITINEIGMLLLFLLTLIEIMLEKTSLAGIHVVDSEIPKIYDAKSTLKLAADEILERGLATQNQSDLFEGLAIFFHLGLLTRRVHGVVDHALASLLENLQSSLDVSSLKQGKLVTFLLL
jgi:hypothetical protein